MSDAEPPAGTGKGEEEWFRRWFGPEYLALYPHRDRAEAERAVRLFLEEGGVGEGARLLDVGCGAGRHLAALRRRSVDAVGLDLSAALLEEARDSAGSGVSLPLVRGDMRRMPFAAGTFDAVTSFFTSFGYFSQRGDRRTLSEIRRVLRPGGRYLLDFLNAEQVRRELVPEEEGTVRGRRVRQTREIRDGHVVKRIEIEPGDPGGSAAVFHERVRLYQPGELAEMLRRAGLPPAARFGDYRGGEHRDDSPRLIVIGRSA